MWKALENALIPVAPGGQLFIAIYNDQGTHSRRWRAVKRFYNRTPPDLRGSVALGVAVHQWGRRTVKDFLLLRPFSTWRTYSVERGMSPWRDVVDWIGGYPFEVAKPEKILDFYRSRNLERVKLQDVRRQFRMQRVRVPADLISHDGLCSRRARARQLGRI